MTKERSGLIRLSMAFVEESDIGTYGLRVFNEHGEQKFLTASNNQKFDLINDHENLITNAY